MASQDGGQRVVSRWRERRTLSGRQRARAPLIEPLIRIIIFQSAIHMDGQTLGCPFGPEAAGARDAPQLGAGIGHIFAVQVHMLPQLRGLQAGLPPRAAHQHAAALQRKRMAGEGRRGRSAVSGGKRWGLERAAWKHPTVTVVPMGRTTQLGTPTRRLWRGWQTPRGPGCLRTLSAMLR